MTLQQQAYGLIDRLSDDSVQIIIQVMIRMLPEKRERADTKESEANTPKMKAYLRMQELRKETAKYDFSESQREESMNEIFGKIG